MASESQGETYPDIADVPGSSGEGGDQDRGPGYELYTARGVRENVPLSDTDSIPFEPEPSGVVLNGSQGSNNGVFSPLHSVVASDGEDEPASDTSHRESQNSLQQGQYDDLKQNMDQDEDANNMAASGQPAATAEASVGSPAIPKVGLVQPLSCIKHGYYKVENGLHDNRTVTILETGEVCTCPKTGKKIKKDGTNGDVDCSKKGCKVASSRSSVDSGSGKGSGNGENMKRRQEHSSSGSLDREGVSVKVGSRRPFSVGKSREMSSFFRNFDFVLPTSDEENAQGDMAALRRAVHLGEFQGNDEVRSQNSSVMVSPSTNIAGGDCFANQDRPETLGSGVGDENRVQSAGSSRHSSFTSSRQPGPGTDAVLSDRIRSVSLSSTGSRGSARSGLSAPMSQTYCKTGIGQGDDIGLEDELVGALLSGGRVSPVGNGKATYSPAPSNGSLKSAANGASGLVGRTERDGLNGRPSQSPAPSHASLRSSGSSRIPVPSNASVKSVRSDRTGMSERSEVQNWERTGSQNGNSNRSAVQGGNGSRHSSVSSSHSHRAAANPEINSETGIVERVKDNHCDYDIPRSTISGASHSDRSSRKSSSKTLSAASSTDGRPVGPPAMNRSGDEVLLKEYQDKWLEMFQMMERQHNEHLEVMKHQHQQDIQSLQAQIEDQLTQQQQLIEEKLGMTPSPSPKRGPDGNGQEDLPPGDRNGASSVRKNLEMSLEVSPAPQRNQPADGGMLEESSSVLGNAVDAGNNGVETQDHRNEHKDGDKVQSDDQDEAGHQLQFGFGDSMQLLREDTKNRGMLHDASSQATEIVGPSERGQLGSVPTDYTVPGDGDNQLISDVYSHDSSGEIAEKDPKSSHYSGYKFDMETPVMKALKLDRKRNANAAGKKKTPPSGSKSQDTSALSRDDIAKVIQSVDQYLYNSTRPKSKPSPQSQPSDPRAHTSATPKQTPPKNKQDPKETVTGEVREGGAVTTERQAAAPDSPGSEFSNFTYWKMEGGQMYKSLPDPRPNEEDVNESPGHDTSKDSFIHAEKFPSPTRSEIDASEDLRSELQQRHLAEETPTPGESRNTSLTEDQSSDDRSRATLKEKHKKHLAELRSYYELEIEDLKSTLTSSDYVKTRSPYKQLERENTRSQDRCKLLEDELLKSKQYIGEMEGQLESMEIRVREYPKRVDAAEDKIRKLQYRLEELTRYSGEKELLVQKLQSKNEELKARLDEAYKLQDLKSSNTSKDASLLKKLQTQHDKVSKDHERSKSMLLSTENELYDARSQITEYKRMVGDLQLEQKRLSRENDNLRRKALTSSLGQRDLDESRRAPPMMSESQATYTKKAVSNERKESSSETNILKVNHDRNYEAVDSESIASQSDADSEDRPLSPLLKAERELDRRKRTLSRDQPLPANRGASGRTGHNGAQVHSASRKEKSEVLESDSSTITFDSPRDAGSDEVLRTPQKRKFRKDRLATKESPKYIVRQSPSGTVEMSVEMPTRDYRSPKRRLEPKRNDASTATRFDVMVNKQPASNKSTPNKNTESRSPHGGMNNGNDLHSNNDSITANYTSPTRSADTDKTSRARKPRSKLSEADHEEREARLNERMRLVRDLEQRLDELLIEKRTAESALSHTGSTSSRENRRKTETLETQLDSIDKELGSIRMALKRNHALKTSI